MTNHHNNTELMFLAFEFLLKEYPGFDKMLQYLRDTTTPITIDAPNHKFTLDNDIKLLLIEAITPYSNFQYDSQYDKKLFFPDDQPVFDQMMGHKCGDYKQVNDADRGNYKQPCCNTGTTNEEHKDDSIHPSLSTKTTPHSLSSSTNEHDRHHHQEARPKTCPLPRWMAQDEFFKKIQFLDNVFNLPRHRFAATQLAHGVTLELAGGNGASSLQYFAYNRNITTVIISDGTVDSIVDGTKRLVDLLKQDGYHGTHQTIQLNVPELTLNDTHKTTEGVAIQHFFFDQTPELLTASTTAHHKRTMMTGDQCPTGEADIQTMAHEILQGKGPKVPKNVDIYLFPATVDQAGAICEALSKLQSFRRNNTLDNHNNNKAKPTTNPTITKNTKHIPIVDTVLELLGLCSTSNVKDHLYNISNVFNNPLNNTYKVVLFEHGTTDNKRFNEMAFQSTFLHWSFLIGCCPIRNLRTLLQENKLYHDCHFKVLSPPTLFLITAKVDHSNDKFDANRVGNTVDGGFELIDDANAHREMAVAVGHQQSPATPVMNMDDFFGQKK